MKLGFITAADLSRYFPAVQEPLLTHDDIAARDALVADGHSVDPVVWGSDPLHLRSYDRLIVRSPWDYMDSDEKRKGLFLWLKQVADLGIVLENHIHWLKWNSDKIYLRQVADMGAPVVPTRFVFPSDDVDNTWLSSYFAENGSFVLKPTVSAAAKDTFLINSPDIEKNLRSLNGNVSGDFGRWRADRTFMVQPFLAEIVSHGEWSLVYFRGRFSHSVHKRPGADQWLVQDELGGSVVSAPPPQAVLSASNEAVKILTAMKKTVFPVATAPMILPLYMRIDVIETVNGPLIGEIEMIEPELFFLSRHADGTKAPNHEAIAAFVAALTDGVDCPP